MQNDVMEQIRAKEEETEKKVRDAAAEAADRLRQMTVENELRVKSVRETLQENRKEQARQAEAAAEEREKEILAGTRKDAETLRRNAMNRMDAAVALVTEAVLRKA